MKSMYAPGYWWWYSPQDGCQLPVAQELLQPAGLEPAKLRMQQKYLLSTS